MWRSYYQGCPGAVREEFVYDQRGGRAEQGNRGKTGKSGRDGAGQLW